MPYVDAEADAWNKDLTRRYCSRIGTNLIFDLYTMTRNRTHCVTEETRTAA